MEAQNVNSSGLSFSSMSESTELMVGAAVLVVLIIVIYLIWKWYNAPATPTTPAATMMNKQAVVSTRGPAPASSDQVNFGSSRIANQQDSIATIMHQHNFGKSPSYADYGEAMQEEQELVLAGVFDGDMSVAQMDGAPNPHMRNVNSNKHLQHVTNISKQVDVLSTAISNVNSSPAVKQQLDKVKSAIKDAKNAAVKP